MKREIEAERHAVIKGRILSLLKDVYPKGCDFVLLRNVLGNMNIPLSREALGSYLVYLEQVGYVALVHSKYDDSDILVATITPRGLNFCDGRLDNPDPGVVRV